MRNREQLQSYPTKPRVFIISDICNEPDDAESLCRYLLYSNEFDTRGLVACTSTWMKHAVRPDAIQSIVNAYGQVVDNLNEHVHPENPYTTAADFLRMIRSGPVLYGKEVLAPDLELSEGARLLIDSINESNEPLWVLCWGGTNVLAQALQHEQRTASTSSFEMFQSKIHVYGISDQDDTGTWIRLTFPSIFYIASIHAWNQYALATWAGISGDRFYAIDQGGPDFTKVSKEWIKENIQIGPFGHLTIMSQPRSTHDLADGWQAEWVAEEAGKQLRKLGNSI